MLCGFELVEAAPMNPEVLEAPTLELSLSFAGEKEFITRKSRIVFEFLEIIFLFWQQNHILPVIRNFPHKLIAIARITTSTAMNRPRTIRTNLTNFFMTLLFVYVNK